MAPKTRRTKPAGARMGPTQNRWYATGYQEALRDIADVLERGGQDAVEEWLRNNRRPAA